MNKFVDVLNSRSIPSYARNYNIICTLIIFINDSFFHLAISPSLYMLIVL